MRAHSCVSCESRCASYLVTIPLLLIAALVLCNLPELRRYLRISRM